MLAQRFPQCLERVDRQHLAHPRQAEAKRQPNGRGDGCLHVAVFKGVPDARGLGAETVEAPRFGGAGKGVDRITAARRVGPQVERTAIAPGMAGEAFGLDEGEMVVKPLAQAFEQRFENPAGGEYRGAGIHGNTLAGNRAQLAARCRHALDNRDRHAGTGKLDGGDKAADTGSDDDDTRFLRHDDPQVPSAPNPARQYCSHD